MAALVWHIAGLLKGLAVPFPAPDRCELRDADNGGPGANPRARLNSRSPNIGWVVVVLVVIAAEARGAGFPAPGCRIFLPLPLQEIRGTVERVARGGAPERHTVHRRNAGLLKA